MRVPDTNGLTGDNGSASSQTALGGFLTRTLEGMGIEELLMDDVQTQRRAGRAIRRAELERQRTLVEKAVHKMKKAADSRVTSAVFCSMVQVGASVLNCAFGDTLAAELGKTIANSIGAGAQALATGLSKLNPYEMNAVVREGKAKMLQHCASEAGQEANDTRDWIQSARQLESKLIDHVEKLSNSEHQSFMEAVKRL